MRNLLNLPTAVATAIVFLTAGLTSLTSLNAAGLETPIKQIFDDAYVSTTGALKFESQTRGYMTFGHARVRFATPLGTIRPFSVTPPSINLGCNGIDITMGGFSYIKGEDLVKKLKSMSGAASAFFFEAALSTLCKDCMTILNKLEDFANAINGLGFDSCAAAKAIGTHFGNKFGEMVKDESHSSQEAADEIGEKPSLAKTLAEATDFLQNLDLTDMFICGLTGGCPSKYALANGQGSLLQLALATNQSGISAVASNKNELDNIASYVRGLTGDLYGYTIAAEGNSDDNEIAFIHIMPTPNAVNGFWDTLMYGESACVTSTKGEQCFERIKIIPDYDYASNEPAPYPAVAYLIADIAADAGLVALTTNRLNGVIAKIDNGQALTGDDKAFLGALPFPIARTLNAKKAGLFDEEDMTIIVEFISTQQAVSIISEILDVSHRGVINVHTLWSKSVPKELKPNLDSYLQMQHTILAEAKSAARIKQQDIQAQMNEVTKKAQALIEQEEALRKMFFKSAAARMGGGKF
jgi:conjugative transfer pilus assembly protein TraH